MFAGNKIYGGKILQQSEPNRKIFFGHRKNLQNCCFSVLLVYYFPKVSKNLLLN